MFSYENKTKTNFENKENEFTIFNILYINKKTVMCCFLCFRIKSKTRDLVDWDKTCETPRNPDFLRNDKMVISVKIRNFSRCQISKRISPLESSREI